jgi:glycine hydroxymethyltransferase
VRWAPQVPCVIVSTPFWGPDFHELPRVDPELARAVTAEQGTAAGDRELAAIADEVSTPVARTPAYPRG